LLGRRGEKEKISVTVLEVTCNPGRAGHQRGSLRSCALQPFAPASANGRRLPTATWDLTGSRFVVPALNLATAGSWIVSSCLSLSNPKEVVRPWSFQQAPPVIYLETTSPASIPNLVFFPSMTFNFWLHQNQMKAIRLQQPSRPNGGTGRGQLRRRMIIGRTE
jgi:hypothetical protein